MGYCSAPGAARASSVLRPAALAWAILAGAPALAGKPHEHGVARADVGVEVGRITLSLEVPLEDLVGFERAPRSDAERTAVAAALGKLQQVARVDAAGGCGAAKVDLLAPVWGVGMATSAASATSATSPALAPTPVASVAAGAGKAGNEHADLQATFEFRCSNAERATHLELALFEAFARLKRIEVQVATTRGQMKLSLRRPSSRVALAR